MIRKLMTGLLASMLISLLAAGTALAYTQQEIDNMTGPSFGISNTYTPTEGVTAKITADETGTEYGERGEYIGKARTTAFCPCRQCCGNNTLTYTGTVPTVHRTVAVDPDVIPLGTKIMFAGSDIVYTAEDIGSGVNDLSVDIFVATHQEAEDYGVKYIDVYYAKVPQ